ncbi:MAG TPA: hypothetical protein VK422_22250, partial [Pyrinomonadaceae bacterium]|nr:hypothetical protein [Pyrinomonadaceae bacterium]
SGGRPPGLKNRNFGRRAACFTRPGGRNPEGGSGIKMIPRMMREKSGISSLFALYFQQIRM